MNTKVVVVVAVVLALVLVVEGMRGQRGGGRRQGAGQGGSRRRWNNSGRRGAVVGLNYMWTRNFEGDQVDERALAVADPKFVVLNSSDTDVAAEGYQTASVFYSFPENGEPLMAIATEGNRRGRPCFLTSTDLTYDEMVSELEGRNVSSTSVTIFDDQPLSLDGTGVPLSREQARALYRANPGLRRVCRRGKFFDTRVAPQAPEGNAEPVETRVIKVLIFDNTAEITFPVQGSGRGAGRGQGRRGQGQGRRGQGQGRRGQGQGRRGHGQGRRGQGQGRRGQGQGRRQGRRGNRNGQNQAGQNNMNVEVN